jgi:hypothetical protein
VRCKNSTLTTAGGNCTDCVTKLPRENFRPERTNRIGRTVPQVNQGVPDRVSEILRRLDDEGADQPTPDGIPEQDGKNEGADDPAR